MQHMPEVVEDTVERLAVAEDRVGVERAHPALERVQPELRIPAVAVDRVELVGLPAVQAAPAL